MAKQQSGDEKFAGMGPWQRAAAEAGAVFSLAGSGYLGVCFYGHQLPEAAKNPVYYSAIAAVAILPLLAAAHGYFAGKHDRQQFDAIKGERDMLQTAITNAVNEGTISAQHSLQLRPA